MAGFPGEKWQEAFRPTPYVNEVWQSIYEGEIYTIAVEESNSLGLDAGKISFFEPEGYKRQPLGIVKGLWETPVWDSWTSEGDVVLDKSLMAYYRRDGIDDPYLKEQVMRYAIARACYWLRDLKDRGSIFSRRKKNADESIEGRSHAYAMNRLTRDGKAHVRSHLAVYFANNGL